PENSNFSEKKPLALRFHFMNFGLNLYNGVMYFEQEMLCSERIKCEFQGGVSAWRIQNPLCFSRSFTGERALPEGLASLFQR
ncbi:MAG: hypothetical protein LUE08_00475, partial [Akkermansiaceae bacterium]|nr:hypothetical protein [Akkermansiaceae bacterium]